MDIKPLNGIRPHLDKALTLFSKDCVWLEELVESAPKGLAELSIPKRCRFEITTSGNKLVLSFLDKPVLKIHKFLVFTKEVLQVVLGPDELLVVIDQFPDISIPIAS